MKRRMSHLIVALWTLIIAGSLRIAERVDTFVLSPSQVQKTLIGQQIAGVAKLSKVDISGSVTGDMVYTWVYHLSEEDKLAFERSCWRSMSEKIRRMAGSSCLSYSEEVPEWGSLVTASLDENYLRVISASLPARPRKPSK